MDRIGWLKERLIHLYDRNPYVGLLRMRVEDIRAGEATLSMAVEQARHGNLYGMAHGGAVASLADTAMGVACATVGKRVFTLEMNLNYIAGAGGGEVITAAAKVLHDGERTMVVEAELRSGDGRLLSKARGTFFVIGMFEFDEE